jgi:hypothetical protein
VSPATARVRAAQCVDVGAALDMGGSCRLGRPLCVDGGFLMIRWLIGLGVLSALAFLASRRVAWITSEDPIIEAKMRAWDPVGYAKREEARRRACFQEDERIA